jgi:hypothetical protein
MNKSLLKEYFHANIQQPVELGLRFDSIDKKSAALVMSAIEKCRKQDCEVEWEEAKTALIEVADERGLLHSIDDTRDLELLLLDAIDRMVDGLDLVKKYLTVKNGL